MLRRVEYSENYSSKLHQNVISIERMAGAKSPPLYGPFSLSSTVSRITRRSKPKAAQPFPRRDCGDCAVVVVVVVRMSQRHAFVAYNCSQLRIVSFFSSLSLVLFCHRGCSWRTPGCPYDIFVSSIYIREKTLPVCVLVPRIDATKFGSEDTP